MDKSKGLIGLHHFTGADWGGKFVGVSKKTWISNYLSLPSNDEIVRTFTSMGHDLNLDPTACKDLLNDGNLYLCSIVCSNILFVRCTSS